LSVFNDIRADAKRELARIKEELKLLHDKYLEEFRSKLEEIKQRYSKQLSQLE
jgi:predicted HicB family RNase H-like nuclease